VVKLITFIFQELYSIKYTIQFIWQVQKLTGNLQRITILFWLGPNHSVRGQHVALCKSSSELIYCDTHHINCLVVNMFTQSVCHKCQVTILTTILAFSLTRSTLLWNGSTHKAKSANFIYREITKSMAGIEKLQSPTHKTWWR
jgi:hypothetical protein